MRVLAATLATRVRWIRPLTVSALVWIGLLTGCAPTLKQAPLDKAAVALETEKQMDLAFNTWLKRQTRLEGIAWRLSTSSAELCPSNRPGLGLVMHKLSSYQGDFRESAGRRFHLGDHMTLRAVQREGPADRAGLAAGDTLLAAGGKRFDRLTIGDALSILQKAAAGEDSVHLQIQRDGIVREISMLPVPMCDYPASVTQDDIVNAYADGSKVYIAGGMMRFAETDDELALVVAHEIAHNALGHITKKRSNAFLGALVDVAVLVGTGVDTQGMFSGAASQAFSQQFESEADYAGLYMAARAGYDVSSAAEFWRRMAAEHPSSIKKNFAASHPSTPERFLGIENAIKEIEQKRQGAQPLVPEGAKVSQPK